MAKKRKKPTMEQFNTKLRKAVARLNSEKTRLKITPEQLAIIAALFGDTVTVDTWCYLWELYAGGDATCTRNVIKAVEKLRTKLEQTLAGVYKDIPASLWNDDDRSTFDRTTGTTSKHTKPGQITDQCIVAWKQFGSGKMKASCKSAHDQSRASKAENSDGVQIHYEVVDQLKTAEKQPDPNGVVKVDAAFDPDKCSNREYFSKATFILDLGIANSGRVLLYYIRWYNSKYPGNAGPWMGPYSQNIL
jgi:hypothetical protein